MPFQPARAGHKGFRACPISELYPTVQRCQSVAEHHARVEKAGPPVMARSRLIVGTSPRVAQSKETGRSPPLARAGLQAASGWVRTSHLATVLLHDIIAPPCDLPGTPATVVP